MPGCFRRKFYAVVFILVFLTSAVYGQDSPDTYPDDEMPIEVEQSLLPREIAGEAKLVQRLSWNKAQYAVRYTVILERLREDINVYVEVLRRNLDADAFFINVSVPSGQYRYKVISYNIFNEIDSETPWSNFVILKANQPSIVSFSPQAFYFDRFSPRIINLTGENLLPDTDLFLVSRTELDEKGEPRRIRPVEMHRNDLGETARMIFLENDLAAGAYDIFAVNPGGLESKTGPFRITMAKPYDINLTGGISPMLTIYGLKENFYDRIFNMLAFSARVSYIPFKWGFGNLGVEFNPTWAYLTSEDDNYKTSGHLFLAHINALFQYWILKNKLSVNARTGMGIAGIFNYQFLDKKAGIPSRNSYNTMAFSIDLGASVQWFFYRQFFLEGGIDYFHFAHREISMGFIRIGLFAGYQF